MTWEDVRAQILANGGKNVTVPLSIEHPSASGAHKSIGLPKGQISDWRFPPFEDCSGMHAREYADRWEAHIDAVSPDCSVVGHARTDTPLLWIAGGAVLGTGVGAIVSRPLLGGVIGATLACITIGVRS